MDFNTVIGLISSIAAGIGLATGFLGSYQRLAARKKGTKKALTYQERIAELTRNLNKASADADGILQEIAKITEERQKALTLLEEKQTGLQSYIDSLEKGPAETLKIYQQLLEQQVEKQIKDGRKIALRYFIYGTIVTFIITVIGIVVTLHPFW